MLIGIPREIKDNEYRVGLIPSGVKELCYRGHKVIIETQAASAVGFSDQHYIHAGAQIVDKAKAIYQNAEIIIKVKEPQPSECKLLTPNHILLSFLHLAADKNQTELLVKSKATAIAYETITDSNGNLPLLSPMSEVAGRLSIQAGAHCLEKAQGGNGMLLGGVPGVEPASVTIIGGGVVGINAARMAAGLGARVTVLDKNIEKLKMIDDVYGASISTLFSTTDTIERQLEQADLVIGAVLIPGAAAPKLVSRNMLNMMKQGSVLVDVAIDQGGCFSTSRPTTHTNPTYSLDGIVHYCVSNMPGAVARTSTFALTNATLPFIIKLADNGIGALKTDNHFSQGLNIFQGSVTNFAVADALGYEFIPPHQALNRRHQ